MKKIRDIIELIGTHVSSFSNDLSWSKYSWYIDGKLARLSVFVPLIGYLVLFNDSAVDILSFSKIIGDSSEQVQSGINSTQRLRLIYFGLVFLGVGNLIFQWKKPPIFIYGDNQVDFREKALESFTLLGFRGLYEVIISKPDYKQNKEFEKQWGDFLRVSKNADVNSQKAGFHAAKQLYGSFLRELLLKSFKIYDSKRRFLLFLCLCFSTLGYLLLFIPSAEVFIRILLSVFKLS